MKDKILELRELGYSYGQIEKELGCSKSTISYHCGEGQKEKSRTRQRKSRLLNPIASKIESFKNQKQTQGIQYVVDPTTVANRIKYKVDNFLRREGTKLGKIQRNFTVKDLLEKFGEDPECYLTGKLIDLNKPETYSLDHIIPASKGGENTLENLGLLTREANRMKSDLEVEEMLQVCVDILINWGIIEERPITKTLVVHSEL